MHLVRRLIGGRDDMCGSFQRGADVATLGNDAVDRVRRPHPLEQLGVTGQRGREPPGDLELPGGANRIILATAGDFNVGVAIAAPSAYEP